MLLSWFHSGLHRFQGLSSRTERLIIPGASDVYLFSEKQYSCSLTALDGVLKMNIYWISKPYSTSSVRSPKITMILW
ncbi:hypothetical protein PILCRDRAFT_625601 [Piloderma croceum F 1598]|uniref:Uncharacterized protein n=1 Tax=Piloderma croceum (strain F 1598) TaxID=765440 RepID=A0A0C3EXJ3_PILCF|nr:hypothetical protein PILCRDRAFT_625601 [Piloderma croceum F 1598]